ncbi:amino acid ABC transporter ATP-binding protein [Amycolatopsis jejuensis]|uniref:amino acid ABC transporter ATP-binding protein n=1 Tax=Amycolatopsis jejuensis TaxID=330084 RepID=UPI0005253FDF|nr:amino acid ABC transporter ATP-binding protein [Amycolatopsis jejuensis]
MSDVLVEIHDVHKGYGSVSVLNGVSMQVRRGEVTCVLGRSGSGKTTLLRSVNHLERIDAGWIRIDGELVGYRRGRRKLRERPDREVARMRSEAGMVFQQFNLFPHMTVLDNVIEAPMRVRGMPRADAVARARELLDQVGLGPQAEMYPRRLSGGQQQRVAIARALAMSPKLMLFDEPTSALDPELVGEVLQVMRRLAGEGMTMMVVTHELAFAREVADSVVFMENGRIAVTGTPGEVLRDPGHPGLAAFLSRFN